MASLIPATTTGARIRVLIVDDSAVVRGLLVRTLESDPEIEIADCVANGRAAVAAVSRGTVDVVLLDVDMPVMDGLAAIPLLLKAAPGIKIVMASTLTTKNAQVTLDALAAGAADYVLKPSATRAFLDASSFSRELLAKVRQFKMPQTANPAPSAVTIPHPVAARSRPTVLRAPPTEAPEILVICSSTGGPPALQQVVKGLSAPLRIPLLIVQHMPPTFTGMLATHISRHCGVVAAEAVDGTALQAGRVYIAPGNFHMTIDAARTIRLDQGEPENFCRPSANPTLRSLAKVYGRRVLAVILTGMGTDGLEGCKAVIEAGGAVIAQDEATSVVWGMPGAVAMAGLCSAVLPLVDIGPRISGLLR
jgi:two-component system, chemotaxis family, protein-glutamate methylesterase/glutaminase